MYGYEEIYDKVIKKTRTVNLPEEESVKIIDKIYNDLKIGILKPRSVDRRCLKLIKNSITRQKGGKENQSIEKYQIEAFIDNVKPKLNISEEGIKKLENELGSLEEITEENMNQCLREYLDKTDNHSLKMIRNQDFRTLSNSIITIENPKKLGINDECALLYCFIDHDGGMLFELLRSEGEENIIFTRKEVAEEIIASIDKEESFDEEYGDIRELELLDDFRDSDNPDIIKVLFVKNQKTEYLKVKLERSIGSKFLGHVIEEPKTIGKLSCRCEVVVSYCFDYADRVHVYVNNLEKSLPETLREAETIFENPTKEAIISTLSKYKYKTEFDVLVDTFHNEILDCFEDIEELYLAIFDGVALCI